MNLKFLTLGIWLALCLPQFTFAAQTQAVKKGEELYRMNCMACHQLETMVVGPSLIEIAHFYKGKPNEIVKWCMAPGKKRPETIAMPPMSHVGAEGLLQIATYILQATEGKVFVATKEKSDPYASFPVARVQRIFMPEVGPAAIAVSLNDQLHLCWDAGTCQLRTLWSGGYLDIWPVVKGNGDGLAKLKGNKLVYLTQGNPFGKDAKLQFKGYSMQAGLPIFKYELNGHKVSVSFKAVGKDAVAVHYQCDFQQAFTYKPNLSMGSWSSDKGELVDGQLKLSAAQGQNFVITFKAGGPS